MKKFRHERPARLDDPAKAGFLKSVLYLVWAVAMAFVSVMLGFVVCVFLIPLATTSLAGITGVNYDSQLLEMVVLLFIPALAMSAIFVYGYIALLRKMNSMFRAGISRILKIRDTRDA